MKRLVLGLLLSAAVAAPAFAGPREDALLEAIRSGDDGAVQQLLAGKADANYILPDTSSILAWAVDRHDEKAVQLLLAAGARPGIADQDGATPLTLACESAAPPAIIGALVKAHADVNVARWDGVTAIEICAGYSTPAVLETLIAAGAGADAPDPGGQTPLMWAAAHGRADNFAALLKHGADINRASRKGFTPLFFAIKSGTPGMAEAVLAAGGDGRHVAPDGTTALQLAIYQGDFTLASDLVARGADVKAWDENGDTPLQAAAIAGDVGLIKTLLAHGADPNALSIPSRVNWQKEPNSNTPVPPFVAMPALLLAAQNGHADAMKALVAGGANKAYAAADDTNALLAAARGGTLEALVYAFELTPNPNVSTHADKQDFNTLSKATGLDVMHCILANKRVMISGKFTPDTPAMMKYAAAHGAPLTGKDTRGHTLAQLVFTSSDEVKAAYADILKTQTPQVLAQINALPRTLGSQL